MQLLENLHPLAPLLGTWSGPGSGAYPTISSFTYTEELTFTDVGKPFLAYAQRTWSPDGAPMHSESGFLRMPAPGTVEMTLAQPTGQTELLEGTWEEIDTGFRISLRGRVMNSASAKTVDATEREYVFSAAPGEVLSTSFAMAAVGEPMTHHLASELRAT
ncbi:MAG TPA: FABP family protein [Beutenbergiaceae bacterium]|nr:FABP family protein [Beutenbergiaceae bacterium]